MRGCRIRPQRSQAFIPHLSGNGLPQPLPQWQVSFPPSGVFPTPSLTILTVAGLVHQKWGTQNHLQILLLEVNVRVRILHESLSDRLLLGTQDGVWCWWLSGLSCSAHQQRVKVTPRLGSAPCRGAARSSLHPWGRAQPVRASFSSWQAHH